MNASEQRVITYAKKLILIGAPKAAAIDLATIHRSARTKRSQREIEELIDSLNLRSYLQVVNGCFIPKD